MKNFFSIWFLLLLVAPLFSSEELVIKPFTPESETEIYDPENLFEYINGAADNFLSYGFQQLTVRDFSFENVQFSVELYNMGTPLNAFGIYKSEKPQDAPGLKIGAESVISPPYQALLVKGNFYVKINAYEGELNASNGPKILKAVAEAIPGEDHFPEQISLLPGENKIPGSEGFIREAFLGMSFLKRCLFARYQLSDSTTFRYFIIIPEKKEPTKKLWKKLASNWKSEQLNETSILIKKIPYKGYAGVFMQEDLIYGVADCKNAAQVKKLLLRFTK